MIIRKRILFVIEWIILADQTTAFMTGCSGGFCFISSPPIINMLSWDSAQRWCSDNGTRLVEITNKDMQDAISSFLITIRSIYSYDRNLFTNGKRESGRWSWLTGNPASNLYIGGVSDASFAYGYLQLTTSASTITATRSTDTKSGYICQNENQCTATTGVVLNFRCYTSYSNVWLSWYDARSRCLANGGDLASFDFITQNQDLRVLNGSWLTPNYYYWLGLRQEWWIWQGSRADVKYSNWLSSHPNTYPSDPNDCLCLDPNQWKWSECRCSETKPFICLSDIRSSTTTTRSSSTTTTTPTTTTTTTSTSTTTATSTTTSISTSIQNPSTSTTTSSLSNERISDVVRTISSQQPFENSLPSGMYSSSVAAAGLGQHNSEESLNRDIAIGIGAGVGGGVVVVILVVVVAFIIIRKRSQRSNPEKKDKTKKAKKLQTPDIIALQITDNQEENPYGTVIPLPEFEETNASENAPTDDDKPQTIYANLEFLTGSSLADNSSSPEVANDSGNSRPMSTIAEADVEVDQIDYNNDQYTTGTCATFL